MKHFIIFLLFFSVFAFADEEVTEIFETYKDAVVYVQQTLYFKALSVKNTYLFNRLEKQLKRKILDSYFPIAVGSGFLITENGHIITNHHVIDITNLDDLREDALWGYLDSLLRNLPDNFFSSSEFEMLIDDFEVLYKNSEFFYRVTIKNKDHYTPEIIVTDKNLDLALLKIEEAESYISIPLGDSDTLKVGHSVIALGYPLQLLFDHFTQDLKSTLSKGNISAIRDETTGIQHTAFITFGNSGGPLLNMNGEVIGINARLLNYGADIFFSIPSNKLTKWLEDKNKQDIIALNDETSEKYTPGEGSVIAGNRKILETGKSLFIKLEEGYEIYIGDVHKGTTPLLINDLEIGETYLRIESEEQYHGIKLVVIPGRTDIVTYSPKMGKYVGNLFIESTPAGAAVYIDGKKKGETPVALSDITAEKHTLKLVLKDYLDHEEEIEVIRKDTLKFSAELEKTYHITFQNPLPENTEIKVFNDDNEYTYSEKDKIRVIAGEWTIKLTNKLFKETSFTYEISDNKKISFAPVYYRSFIRFSNLIPESRVLFDDIDITDKLSNNAYETRIGDHEIRIKTEDYLDYCRKFELEKEKDLSIEVIYKISPAVAGKRNARIGYPTLGAGVLFAVTGLIINHDTVAVNISDNYSGYVTVKWTGFSIACTGLAAIVVGSVYAVISSNNFTKAESDSEIWDDISFSFDFRDTTPVLFLHFHLKE